MNESILVANSGFLENLSAILYVDGNTIINGWLTSWTTWLIGGILFGLIIWNIILSIKLSQCVKSGDYDNE